MSCKNWADYWSDDDFWRDQLLWEINSRLFFKRANAMLGFHKHDSVLDIGCGQGYTESLLSPLVGRLCAVDVAEQFVAATARRCGGLENVRVRRLSGEAYTDLPAVEGPFSVILCVSVVQYYRSIDEVRDLIVSAGKVALPGCRMLIADLPLERNAAGFFWDALCSFWLGVREGYAGVLLKAAFKRWCAKTRYRDFRAGCPELAFSRKKIESLLTTIGFDAIVLEDGFSVNANRLSVLIRF